ncbi:MAG: sulfatase-like hydrolase/transferase [Kiritimatiellales bacterium]
MKKPNILFILADDLGYGDLACFGNDAVRTPNLDRLAREGVSLIQHYSASPLCAPARAALLTGRYNHRTGAVDVPSNRGLDRIALSEKTIADYFKEGGYVTGMVGKWHNGLHDMRYHPCSRGFDEFIGFLNGGMDYYDWALDWNGELRYSDGRYLTDVFTDASVNFIEKHLDDPFFLYLAYNAPHTPFQAPEKKIQYYRDMNRFTEQVCCLYAMIEQMDAGIGKILETLEVRSLREDTIIVFTSDNGPQFINGADRYNGPFSGAKGNILEGGIRVPAMVSWPRYLPKGATINSMIHFCDWLPTLLSWSMVKPDFLNPIDGFDRSKVFTEQNDDVEDIHFWQRNRYAPIARCNGAMRDGRWKLILPMRAGGDNKSQWDNGFYIHGLKSPHWLMDVDRTLPEFEIGPELKPCLYDISTDPGEQNDLAEKYPELVTSMLKSWDQWFEEMNAEWRNAYDANIRPVAEGTAGLKKDSSR